MKFKLLFLVCMVWLNSDLRAQYQIVLSNRSAISHLDMHGTEMYFSQNNLKGLIGKTDLSSATPTFLPFLDNLQNPSALIIDGNIMYYSVSGIRGIYKVDITQSPLKPSLVWSGSSVNTGTAEMVKKGNDLYISYHGAIDKIDVTKTTPTAQTVVPHLYSAVPMVLDGDDLYFGTYDTIKKIDLTGANKDTINVLTGVKDVTSMLLDGNYLYYSNGFGINRIDLTQSNPQKVVVLPVYWGIDMHMYNSELYFTITNFRELAKIEINETTGQDHVVNKELWSLHPNPVASELYLISTYGAAEIRIFNAQGSQVMKTMTEGGAVLDVSELAPGLYFVQAPGRKTLRFLKN